MAARSLSFIRPEYDVSNGEIRRGHTLPAGRRTIDLYLVQDHNDPLTSGRDMGIRPTSSVQVDGLFHERAPSIPMLEHLRKSTPPMPVLTLVDELSEARRDQSSRQSIIDRNGRRMRSQGGWGYPDVVIHHVRFTGDTQAYFFNRAEMLELISKYGEGTRQEAEALSREQEWYVWGGIPAEAYVAILPPIRRTNFLKRLEEKLEDFTLPKPSKDSWKILLSPNTSARRQGSPARAIAFEQPPPGQTSSQCICQPPMQCLCFEMTDRYCGSISMT